MVPVVSLLLCLLTVTTDDYADLIAYVNYYGVVQSGGCPEGALDLPVGWLLLNKAVSVTGLSVRGFICIVLVLCVLLTARFYRRIGCSQNLQWALFLLFPALVQCVQLRFFLGFSIVLVSFAGIVNSEKFGIARFVIGTLLAFTIHSSMLVFLILAPAGKLGALGRKKGILIVLFLAVVVNLSIGYIPGIAEHFLSDVKYERYFVSGISATTLSWFLKILLIWAAILALSYLCVRVLSQSDSNIEKMGIAGSERSSILLISIALTGVTLPLLQFDSNFHRFIEMGFMLSYAIFSYLWQSAKVPSARKMLLLLCVLPIGAIAAYVYEPFETVILPLLSYDGFQSLFS